MPPISISVTQSKKYLIKMEFVPEGVMIFQKPKSYFNLTVSIGIPGIFLSLQICQF